LLQTTRKHACAFLRTLPYWCAYISQSTLETNKTSSKSGYKQNTTKYN